MIEDGKLSNEERVSILDKLFDALLRRLLAMLTADTPPKAIVLDITRKLLSDHGIRAVSRPELRTGLQAIGDLRGLPFDDKGRKQ